MLQYADDTLILMRGELADVERLKSLLDQFSAATGLHGNYHKSTAVPMHMSEDDIPRCISALGCKREGFPQAYLGLPLSCEKLRLSAFDPYIGKADRHLAGWQASLLNPMGRTVLINSVLQAQLPLDLAVQNTCMLLKLLHKLYDDELTSWARWVRQNVCLATLEGDVQGTHWNCLPRRGTESTANSTNLQECCASLELQDAA